MKTSRLLFISGALLALGIFSAQAETIFVTNANDSGSGSLRQAIMDANTNPSATTILINIPGPLGSDRIILVPTALPAFTAPVELRIDGGQTGKAVLKAPIISGPGAATTGLTFEGGSANSKVEFITFRDFVFSIVLNTGAISINNNHFENNQGGIDIRLLTSGGNSIKGNVFLTSHTGASAIAGATGGGNTIQGNGFTGTGINLGSGGNIIGGVNSADPNTFTNTPGAAISLSNGSGSQIIHNTIHGSNGNAILVSGVDMRIEHNNLSGNTGWDILVSGGHSNKINHNQVMGDNGIFNGILLQNGVSYTVGNNSVSGGSIELENMSASSWYGQLTVTGNTIVNDPNGFSGHGALSLYSVNSAMVRNNEIHHNGGSGIYLNNAQYNQLTENTIYENFRVGIYVGNLLYNKISKNVIYGNHADVYGGRTGIFATAKTAPTITSAKRVGNNFVVTGTGSVANDSLEFFLSDQESRNSTLKQNAFAYKASVKATGTSWTATFPVGLQGSGDVYFMATATNTDNTTSSFSKAVGVEINGPVAATTNHPSTYFAEYIPGASYSWWSTLPISSQSQAGHQGTFNFNQVGSGTVWVGYTDPGTGQWKMYSLAVTVFGPARTGLDADETSSLVSGFAYPNPFLSSTHISVEGMENISIQLFDDKGSLVYASDNHLHGETIELGTNLKPGIYTLKTISGEHIETTRIIKAQ